MVNIQESAVKPMKKPYFKTVFYKDVELFIHRDPNQQPVRLRLYDAESGWIIAAGASRYEGRNEEELLRILESKLVQANQQEKSFKELITRLRRESPPKQEQQAIRNAYVEAMAASRESKATCPAVTRGGLQPPVRNSTTKVAVKGDQQPRKEIAKMPEIQQQKRRCNLVLHCGASAVQRVDVARVNTPRPTDTWTPIPHIHLLSEVEGALRSVGLRIGHQAHAITPDGARYFGLSEVHCSNESSEYALIVGVRNSHDKTFPVSLAAGNCLFICDNLAFSGEVRLTRKHTTHLQRDLPKMVATGVGKLMTLWNHQGQRVEAYKNTKIRDRVAHDLIVRATDLGAITNRMIPSVLKEWREPSYPVFKDRTAWSLFNAATEVLKLSGNLPELPNRTEALHALFDTHVGLPAAHLN